MEAPISKNALFVDASHDPKVRLAVLAWGLLEGPIYTRTVKIHGCAEAEKLAMIEALEFIRNSSNIQIEIIYTDHEASTKMKILGIDIIWIKGHKPKAEKITPEDHRFSEIDKKARKVLRAVRGLSDPPSAVMIH